MGSSFGVNLNTTGLGLGAGIDVQATVAQLVQAARAPEQAMTQQTAPWLASVGAQQPEQPVRYSSDRRQCAKGPRRPA